MTRRNFHHLSHCVFYFILVVILIVTVDLLAIALKISPRGIDKLYRRFPLQNFKSTICPSHSIGINGRSQFTKISSGKLNDVIQSFSSSETIQTFMQDIGLFISKSIDTIDDIIIHLKRKYSSMQGSLSLNDLKLETANDLLAVTSIDGYIRRGNKTRIIIAGSGWAAHAFLKVIDTTNYEVICISPRPYFIFTPMLAATAVGTIEWRSIIEPIRSSNPFIDYIESELLEVDSKNQTITARNAFTSENLTIEYDHLVYAIGATTNTFGFATVEKYCNFIKEIDDVKKVKQRILDNFELASIPSTREEEINRLLTFIVVGGGPTGVEFAGELHDFVRQEVSFLYPRLVDKVVVRLINSGSNLLNAFDQVLQQVALEALIQQGIDVRLNARVIDVRRQSLTYTIKDTVLNSSLTIESSFGMCIWAGGTAARPITRKLATCLGSCQETSVQKTGRLQVDHWLRVSGSSTCNLGSMFALGDCSLAVDNRSSSGRSPLPQTAQVAGQQGAYLARIFNKEYNMSELIPSLSDPIKAVFTRGVFQAPAFEFLNLGLLAYIGGQEAVAQVQFGNTEFTKATGNSAYLLWRSVYLVKQVSTRTRFLVLIDYFKSKIFGRDFSGV